ncbi:MULTISPECIES: hypothetical protein [unclassified Polaromonas]|uniref:hypothetical protein n=1 Tax=unclassified Polaromonas TaxID=2638319 RepID=UPI0018CBEA37|nr:MULTISPECIES: hypothetical protein [unclassified Polaromonas]MBG6070735.1 acetate kinase [Polaromonas sp. CG_9.7]MBG6112956.1 acetate kinase [Polaromonas sp. CG_9.2]MDH6186430.1 acetate kinase [Polaromonas sp. CG_23.6]
MTQALLVINSGSSSVKFATYDVVEPESSLARIANGRALGTVGHRVVHGSEKFVRPVVVTP